MKKSLFTTAFCFLSLLIFAQSYKPEPNSFGIQYCASYNGALNQSIVFSGWLKKGIEVRGALGFSFSTNSSQYSDSSQVYYNGNHYVNGIRSSTSKSGQLSLTPNISVLKHLPIKSDVDFFLGGAVNCGISVPTISTQYINEIIADGYYNKNIQTNKNPMTISPGLSLVSGLNYFFAKNIAIGIDGGLGFATSISIGKRTVSSSITNSGVNNHNVNTQTQSSFESNTQAFALSLAGNAGLHIVYYMPVYKAAKGTELKM